MKLAQPGSAELELLRNRAEAEIHLRKRGGDWSAGLTAHSEYQGRPLDWIVERLGVPRETLSWSLNPEYVDHEWDGTRDPLCVALQALADWKSAGIESGTGVGKAAPVDEPVLTPTGWRPIGDLKIGDEVVGSDGKPTVVIGVFPQGELPVYCLRFSDGAETRACGQHLWKIKPKGVNPWRVVNTEQFKTLAENGRNFSWRVPLPKAIQLPERDLYLDPYVLGVLLGDGSYRRSTPRLSTADPEILVAVETSTGTEGRSSDGRYGYDLADRAAPRNAPNPLMVSLRQLGLAGQGAQQKVIPAEYLWGSATQRLALLQGLLDTDGTVRRGHPNFDSTSRSLAEGVVHLVRSLGGVATLSCQEAWFRGRRYNDSFRVHVRLPSALAPFRLQRKLNLVRRAHTLARTIRTIEPDGDAECVCIRVLAADQLYVTNNFIVTHNTFLAACVIYWWLACWEDSIVSSVAPKEDQLLKHVWKEIGKLWPRFARWFPTAELLTGLIRMKPQESGKEVWAASVFVCGVGATEETASKARGLHCLSDDHEILTQRGWLGIDEVTDDDQCLSVPIDGEIAEWKPITAVHRYEYDEPLNVYDGRFVSFAVTDQHRFPTKYNKGIRPWHLRPLSAMKRQFVVRRTSGWFGEHFDVPEPFTNLGFDEHRFAEFVGFWAGDGGVNYRPGNSYEVRLYQTKEDYGYVKKLLKSIKHRRSGDYYAFCNEAVVRWLMANVGQYSPHRRIPSILRNAPPDVLDSLLEGLWRAEGSFAEDGKRRLFYSTSKRLIDDVQEILVKLGRPSTLGINREAGAHVKILGHDTLSKLTCYVISHPYRNSDHIVKTKNIRRESVGKRVWCIATPYQTFYTRRNGRAFLSGNSEHLLIITEETPGIDGAIMKALASTRTDDHNLHLALGNPESRIDQLHRFCFNDRERPRRNVIHVRASALDHPNIVTGRRVVPGAIGRERLADRTEELVEGSRFYKADVRGICPDEAEDALISMAWCVAAAKRWADPALREGPPALGVDVADTPTGDEAAIADWEGACCLEVTSWHIKVDAEEVAEEVYRRAKDPERPIDPRHIGLDNVGVGASAYNRLARLGLRVRKMSTITRVIPMMLPAPIEPEDGGDDEGAESTKLRAVVESERYDHPRSQIWWRFREDLRLGYIALPEDPDLFRQLCVPTYTKKAGKICVQSKEEIVKLLGRSPDKGDACVYGNFVRPRRRRKPAPQEEKIDPRNLDRGLERRLARHNKRIAREERMIKRLLKKKRSRSER